MAVYHSPSFQVALVNYVPGPARSAFPCPTDHPHVELCAVILKPGGIRRNRLGDTFSDIYKKSQLNLMEKYGTAKSTAT